MLSEASGLFDAGALTIVLAGTLIATCARLGWADMAAAIPAALGLWRSDFAEHPNRAELARTARDICKRGHLSAEPGNPPDPATARLLGAYITTGSLDVMQKVARSDRITREIATNRAARVFENAGELAPVFGLVGTLYALTQLMPALGTDPSDTIMGSVASAVLSTLYGVLCAHLVYFPLACAIERKGEREEAARAALIEWFEGELVGGPPQRLPGLRGAA